MKVYLLRHGRTEGNEKKLYYGKTDLPLSKGGIEGLLDLKNHSDYTVCKNTLFYTSGMKRAEESFEILFGNLPHTQLSSFFEMNFGDFEGFSYEELKNNADYIKWCQGDNLTNICPNGESYMIMQKRVLAAFFELCQQNKDFLLLFHGGPISVIMAKLFTKEEKNLWQWQPLNGKGYEITIDNGNYSYENYPKARL